MKKLKIMQNKNVNNWMGAILLFGFSAMSLFANAQEHVTLSLDNITSTANTVEYDLYIVNDGSTSIKLSACAFGVNFNSNILNGATPSENAYQLIPGSQSQALGALSTYSMQKTLTERSAQLRLTMAPTQKANCPVLASNVPYRVGRFRFTNTANWAKNSNPSFALNEFNIPGISTSCAVAYIDNAPNYKGFSTALKNLTCKVANSPVLNADVNAGAELTQVASNGRAIYTDNAVDHASIGRQVSAQEAGTYVSIYPNPTQDMMHIDFQVNGTVNTIVKVLDIRGRIVKKVQARSEKGFNSMHISLHEVPAGTYTVQVLQDNQLSFTDKVTKND
jgi:hypothetical protein